MVLENHKMRAGALRADLGDFRRAEAARKSQLALVGHLLVAKHQNRVLLKGRARRRIDGVIRSDIRKRHAAQLGGKSWTQRNDIHR